VGAGNQLQVPLSRCDLPGAADDNTDRGPAVRSSVVAMAQTVESLTWVGQGAGAYGKRFASTVGASAIHGVLAFGLDSALHQDPRSYRSRGTGSWRRAGHVLAAPYDTHDSGGETVSTWRPVVHTAPPSFRTSGFRTGRPGMQQALSRSPPICQQPRARFWPDLKHKILLDNC